MTLLKDFIGQVFIIAPRRVINTELNTDYSKRSLASNQKRLSVNIKQSLIYVIVSMACAMLQINE